MCVFCIHWRDAANVVVLHFMHVILLVVLVLWRLDHPKLKTTPHSTGEWRRVGKGFIMCAKGKLAWSCRVLSKCAVEASLQVQAYHCGHFC
jgi:hypothetical protein